MPTGLSNFLVEASQNPALLTSLRNTPGVVAQQHGLSPKEMDAVLSRDQMEVQKALQCSTWILHISDWPEPDPEPEPTLQ